MQLSLSRLAVGALVVGVLSACGGGGSDPNGGGGGGGGSYGVTAKINGAAWAPTAQASAAHVSPGLYNFLALNTGGASSSLSVIVYNIRGVGTYHLGVNVTTIGGSAQVVLGTKGWSTPITGLAGTITFTTLSDTRMVGTFSFTGTAISGGATGTVEVTDGVFDLPVTTTGVVGPPPDQNGNSIDGQVAGADFFGATIAVSLHDTTLTFVANSDQTGLSLFLYGLHGTGSYPLSAANPIHTATFSSYDGTNFDLWGAQAGDAGSVTITSVTATRIKGSVNATLEPSSGPHATAPVAVSVDFDLGIPQLP